MFFSQLLQQNQIVAKYIDVYKLISETAFFSATHIKKNVFILAVFRGIFLSVTPLSEKQIRRWIKKFISGFAFYFLFLTKHYHTCFVENRQYHISCINCKKCKALPFFKLAHYDCRNNCYRARCDTNREVKTKINLFDRKCSSDFSQSSLSTDKNRIVFIKKKW